MASKGENDTATSVTIDILRKQPGDKAIIIMIAADAHGSKDQDRVLAGTIRLDLSSCKIQVLSRSLFMAHVA